MNRAIRIPRLLAASGASGTLLLAGTLLVGTLLVGTGVSAQNIEGVDRIDDVGRGDAVVRLLNVDTARIAPGEVAWLHLNWTVADAEARNFRVTAVSDDVEIGYPENTGDHTSLYWDDILSVSEIDYTALKITVPSDGNGPALVAVTVDYVSDEGPQRHDVEVEIEVGDESATVPSTTVPSTTVPSTTVPSTTVPSTTVPSTTPSETTPSETTPTTTVVTVADPTDPTVVYETTSGYDGWRINPDGTDTATSGQWDFGIPDFIAWDDSPTQPEGTPTGGPALVTAPARNGGTGNADVDGGLTTALSPTIDLPVGTLQLDLTWFFAHLENSDAADLFRVSIMADDGRHVIIEERGSAGRRAAEWSAFSFDVSDFGGSTIRLFVEAGDFGGASLIEAGVADISVTVVSSAG